MSDITDNLPGYDVNFVPPANPKHAGYLISSDRWAYYKKLEAEVARLTAALEAALEYVHELEAELAEVHKDTERLDCLLRYIQVDDVGDEFGVHCVVCDSGNMEEFLSIGPPVPITGGMGCTILCKFGDNMIDVIDSAIRVHGGDKT